MVKRTVVLLFAVALTLPALAAAKRIDVKGPLSLTGQGRIAGELTAADGSAETRLRVRTGVLRFTDLGGDMRVACRGRARMGSRKNGEGQTVVVCKIAAGLVTVSASQFRLKGGARRYGIHIAEGVAGQLHMQRIPGDRGRSRSPAEPSRTRGEPAAVPAARGQ